MTSMSDIVIRSATEADFDAIFNLITQLAQFEGSPGAVTNSVAQMKQESEYFQAFVAVNNQDQIVGTLVYFYDYSTYVGKSIHVEDVMVIDTYRGQGIGTRLYQAVIDWARNQGCKRIRWQVLSWNEPAKGFYRKFGAQIDEGFAICSIDL